MFSVPSVHGGRLSLITKGVEGPEGFQRRVTIFGADQKIAGVPPGRYTLEFLETGENPRLARKVIDVANIDVTVQLESQPSPAVSGRVTFSQPGVRPKSPLYAQLVHETVGVFTRVVSDDGTFSVKNLRVGSYRFRLQSSDGFQVAKLAVEGSSLQDGFFDVVQGAVITLNVIAADETGTVNGFVLNEGKAVPGVLVLLAPRKETTGHAEIIAFQTDSDGSFGWPHIGAGDYVLIAVAQLDLEYLNPVVLKPYLTGGKAIRVERHGTVKETIAVAPAAAQN